MFSSKRILLRLQHTSCSTSSASWQSWLSCFQSTLYKRNTGPADTWPNPGHTPLCPGLAGSQPILFWVITSNQFVLILPWTPHSGSTSSQAWCEVSSDRLLFLPFAKQVLSRWWIFFTLIFFFYTFLILFFVVVEKLARNSPWRPVWPQTQSDPPWVLGSKGWIPTLGNLF